MQTAQALLAQFRALYPMGSLISELLTVHGDRFIVRASVQLGGTTFATGMAAADSIETAEDQAKLRALTAFGISTQVQAVSEAPHQPPVAPSLPVATPPEPPTSLPTPTSLEPLQANVIPDPVTPLTPPPVVPELAAIAPPIRSATLTAEPLEPFESTEPIPTEATAWEAPSIVADFYAHLNADENLPAQPESLAMPDEPELESDRPSPGPTPKSASSKGTSRKADSQPAASVPTSMDLSDILAQTDVEIRRLGWSPAQGKEHLKLTYGKASRQRLSEAELYDFLEYLQAQPSPSQTPF